MKLSLTLLRILLVVCVSLAWSTERSRASGGLVASITPAGGPTDTPTGPFGHPPPRFATYSRWR